MTRRAGRGGRSLERCERHILPVIPSNCQPCISYNYIALQLTMYGKHVTKIVCLFWIFVHDRVSLGPEPSYYLNVKKTIHNHMHPLMDACMGSSAGSLPVHQWVWGDRHRICSDGSVLGFLFTQPMCACDCAWLLSSEEIDIESSAAGWFSCVKQNWWGSQKC